MLCYEMANMQAILSGRVHTTPMHDCMQRKVKIIFYVQKRAQLFLSVKVGVAHNDRSHNSYTNANYAGCANLTISCIVSIALSHFHFYQYVLDSRG